MDSLLISPTPAVHTHPPCQPQSLASLKVGVLTRPADEADQLGRAATIITDGDDVVEMALSLFCDPAKHIYETVGRGALGEGRDSMSAAVCGRDNVANTGCDIATCAVRAALTSREDCDARGFAGPDHKPIKHNFRGHERGLMEPGG